MAAADAEEALHGRGDPGFATISAAIPAILPSTSAASEDLAPSREANPPVNVLLLHPEFPNTFWSFKHALKFIRKRAALPPLGLLTVAAMLPAEWKKRLIDMNVEDLRERDLAGIDLAFVSAMTVQRDSARRVIDRCHRAGIPVVAGGPLFTTEPERFDDVDHLVLDEAEISLPRFLADLEQGRPAHVYRAGGYPDLRSTPGPAWELLDLRRYATMSVQYSRGCPFNCEFCNVTAMLGRRMRSKDPAQVVAELEELHRRGWRSGVFFVDDNLIGDRRHLKDELLPAIIRWRQDRPGLTFLTQASIDLADDEELMRRMVEAGFDTVFIGIETPDEESLRECGKHQNRHRDLVSDIRKIHRAGLQVQGGFIVGFDHDAPSIFERQVQVIQEAGVVTAMVGLLQALPGTRLFERLKGEGRLAGDTTGDNVDGSSNIVSRMDPSTLQRGYLGILRRLYSPRPYYRRVRTFLRDYRLPDHRVPLTRAAVFAFLASMIRLGVVGRERVHYWHLLSWTMLRCRRKLALAVTLAIYGHHFRRVCTVGSRSRPATPTP